MASLSLVAKSLRAFKPSCGLAASPSTFTSADPTMTPSAPQAQSCFACRGTTVSHAWRQLT